MIDRDHDLPVSKQAEVLRISPWQHLLSAAAGVGSRPRADAAARRAAPGVPFRREPDVARSSGCRWMQGGPSACEDADEADGDRSALSPPAHHQAGLIGAGCAVCCSPKERPPKGPKVSRYDEGRRGRLVAHG